MSNNAIPPDDKTKSPAEAASSVVSGITPDVKAEQSNVEKTNTAIQQAAGQTKGQSTAQSTSNTPSKKAATENSASTPSSAPKVPSKPSKKRAPIVLLSFVVLVLCAAAGGVGYVYWQQQQTLAVVQNELAQQAANVNQVTQTTAQQVQTLEQAIAQQAQDAQQVGEKNAQLQTELAALRDQVFALTSTTNDDWKLAEAHYLTRLAGQRLLMERDTEAALSLLQAADDIVKNRADPALFKVREQFANDIAALKLANTIDREGMFLSLSAIGKFVDTLPKPVPENFSSDSQIANQPADGLNNSNAPPDLDSLTFWQRVKFSFARATENLQQYIRVSKTDDTIESIISNDTQAFLKTSLRLNLESAQWGLLREEPEVYRESITRAASLLERYYPLSTEAQLLTKQLHAMAEQNVVQSLPDISASQQVLGNYLEQLHRLGDSAPAAEAP